MGSQILPAKLSARVTRTDIRKMTSQTCMEPCYNKAVKSNNKENSASKKQVRRQNHKRAHTVGIPVNQNKSAYVLESEGLSVVPYFKKTPMPRDSPRLKWSMNELTNQPTITRKENYANGRWNETPPKTILPRPPSHWLTPKRESNPLTSTLKSVQLSSLSSCSVDDDDEDDLSVVSGIDNVASCDFASRLCQDSSVYDSGFSQILSEASLSDLASFSIISANSLSECCDDTNSRASSQCNPNSASEDDVFESNEGGSRLLSNILNQVETCEIEAKGDNQRNVADVDDCKTGTSDLCKILASLQSEAPSKMKGPEGNILSTLLSNMKC